MSKWDRPSNQYIYVHRVAYKKMALSFLKCMMTMTDRISIGREARGGEMR